VQAEVESVIQSVFPDVCVTLFGSHQLGLSTFLSDIDLSISMSTCAAAQTPEATVQTSSASSSTSDDEADAEEGSGLSVVPRSVDDHDARACRASLLRILAA